MRPGEAPPPDDHGDARPPGPVAVSLEGPLPSRPARERRHNSLGVVRCTNKVVRLEREIEELLLLSAGPGPLHPGALLSAAATLAGDRPAQALPPGTLVWQLLAGGRPTGIRCRVQPQAAALEQALPQLLAAWHAAGGPHPQAPAADAPAETSSALCSKAYDYAQLSLDLAMAPAWASPELREQLDPGHPREGDLGEHTVVVARLKQVRFSVLVEAPDEPVLAAGSRATGPLAQVRQVDYGRIVFVKMQTRGCPMRMDAEAALRLAMGGRLGVGGASARHERLASAARFTVLFVGEAGEGSLRMEAAAGPVALRALLARPSPSEHARPASAIACRLRLLQGSWPLALRLSTRYNHLECTVFAPGQLVLRHDGAYTARFALSWEIEDETGGQHTTRWASGPQAAGWSHTLQLDGDVRNLRIQAWAASGPAWAPWVAVFSEQQPGPVNRTYTLQGSAASPRWWFRDLPPA